MEPLSEDASSIQSRFYLPNQDLQLTCQVFLTGDSTVRAESLPRITGANRLMLPPTGLLDFFLPLSTSLSDLAFFRFVQGEGAVVVVLKPLAAALADNDHIYSVVRNPGSTSSSLLIPCAQILGSSINSNGGRASLHAPSAIAQQECIIEAFAKAGRDPTEVDMVELHATGK